MGTHLFGKREDPWWSGTMNAFTVPLFGNSHAGLNFRVPLCEETHDTTQPCRSCKRTMQQAARRATRYFTGYVRKPQPVKELEPAAKQKNQKSTTCTLHYLAKQKDPGGCRTTAKSRAPCVWRPRVQMFGSSHHRRVRPLAGFGYASEPTAECIRSFPDVPFVGCEWYHVVRWLFWGCNLQKIFMFSSR